MDITSEKGQLNITAPVVALFCEYMYCSFIPICPLYVCIYLYIHIDIYIYICNLDIITGTFLLNVLRTVLIERFGCLTKNYIIFCNTKCTSLIFFLHV